MTTATTIDVPALDYVRQNLSDLQLIARGPQDAVADRASENCFGWLLDAVWALNPSDLPTWVRHELEMMPNGMLARFDEWCDREGRTLPEAGWGTRTWLCIPSY